MKIDEVLHIAGDLSLKSFVWGTGIADTLNTLFADTQQITVEITGNQALSLLRALPPAAMAGVLAIEIDTRTGRPVGQDQPITPVTATGQQGDVVKRPHKPWFPLAVGVIITLITLFLAVTISLTSFKSGTSPDEGVIKALLGTLVEILKLFLDQSDNQHHNTLIWLTLHLRF